MKTLKDFNLSAGDIVLIPYTIDEDGYLVDSDGSCFSVLEYEGVEVHSCIKAPVFVNVELIELSPGDKLQSGDFFQEPQFAPVPKIIGSEYIGIPIPTVQTTYKYYRPVSYKKA